MTLIGAIASALRAAGPVTPLAASRRAAVAVVLRPLPDGNAAVLYILRRANERDPWSGQVGFPGGRQQESDHDDLATAVRECREEVGLHLDDAESYELLGRLPDRPITASGGRVLNVTARGKTLAEARDRAYAMADAIDWPEGFFRRDIGWRAL